MYHVLMVCLHNNSSWSVTVNCGFEAGFGPGFRLELTIDINLDGFGYMFQVW